MAKKTYWRVAFRTPSQAVRRVWAQSYERLDDASRALQRFEVVDRYGDETDPREFVFASTNDVVEARPAVLSKMYGWLEVTRG